MKEKAFYSFHVLPALKGCHVQRIETMTGRGVPDLNVCYKGNEYWLELKVAIDGKPYLRKEQYVWGMRRSNAGGRCFVVCYNFGPIHIWHYPFPVVHGPKYCHPSSVPTSITDIKSSLLSTLCGLHP